MERYQPKPKMYQQILVNPHQQNHQVEGGSTTTTTTSSPPINDMFPPFGFPVRHSLKSKHFKVRNMNGGLKELQSTVIEEQITERG